MKRSRRIGIWLIALLFVIGAFMYAPKAEAAGDQMQTIQITAYQYYKFAFDVLDLVNQYRGSVKLKMDKDLMAAAMQRAAELSVYNVDHTRPSGKPFSSVHKKTCAENAFAGPLGDGVAAGSMEGWWETPESAVGYWMRFDPKEGGCGPDGKKLINRDYVTAGVGVVRVHENVYWVILLGNKVDESAIVKRADFNTDSQVLKYPKIQVSVNYLKNKTIEIFQSPKVSKIKPGKTASIKLKIRQEDIAGYHATLLTSKLIFTSSDPEIATVTAKGLVTGVSPGVATITVTSKLSKNDAPALAKIKIMVSTGNLTISKQPKDTVVSVGEKASFVLEAVGKDLSYQWYYRKSENSVWKAITAARGKKATYTVTTKLYQDGYQYRCQVTDSSGSVYSDVVTLRLGPTITMQPAETVEAKAGETVTFEVKATGHDLTYQWYFRTSKRGSWRKTNLAGGTESVYQLTTRAKQNGYQYRCKVSNDAGSVYSSILTLKVE